MPRAYWLKKYELGVPAVDEQHGSLFKVINEIDDAIRSGKGAEVVGRQFEFLLEYAHQHFKDEGALLEGLSTRGILYHKAEHARFEAELVARHRRYLKNPTALHAEGFLMFLADWLVNHILKVDMDLKVAAQAANRPNT